MLGFSLRLGLCKFLFRAQARELTFFYELVVFSPRLGHCNLLLKSITRIVFYLMPYMRDAVTVYIERPTSLVSI